MAWKIDMIGKFFGQLYVICESSESTPKNMSYIVRCMECDNLKVMLGGNIRRVAKNNTPGCVCGENRSKSRDGMSNHKFYKTWEGMIGRCYNKNHQAYHRYGGRGVTVCEEWMNPSTFISWLELNGYDKKLEIDRTDNDSGYTPSNCRVTTRLDNANNKSNNRTIYVCGEIHTISEASRIFGVNKTTIKERLNKGWSDWESIYGRNK